MICKILNVSAVQAHRYNPLKSFRSHEIISELLIFWCEDGDGAIIAKSRMNGWDELSGDYLCNKPVACFVECLLNFTRNRV